MNRYYNVLDDVVVFNKQFYAPYMYIKIISLKLMIVKLTTVICTHVIL